ncbi:hypothetical protein [Streptomyces sp. TLI_171]|uniref:hypothetical protein n=1 Tax=Streptomyces sp. TLI_171 TaxID=1938859 RepID=UPI000C19A85A|nr:hypothetical protein [Streptomyces sp. TLI_171]
MLGDVALDGLAVVVPVQGGQQRINERNDGELPGGGFLAQLHCAAHSGREVRWEETVDAATTLGWVADLVAEHS